MAHIACFPDISHMLHTTPLHCTGVLGYNQDHARQRICNWLDGHKASAAAFDFPTKGILQVSIGEESRAGTYCRLMHTHYNVQ